MVFFSQRYGDISACRNSEGEACVHVFITDVKTRCYLATHLTRGDVQGTEISRISRADHNHVFTECELRVSHCVAGPLHNKVRLESKDSA